jgi:hypothetical protein
MNSNEDIDFNPSKINVFLDIAEYDIIPKLTKYINLNGGVQIEIYDYVFNH